MHDKAAQAVPLWPQSGPEAFFSRRWRKKSCWGSLPKPGKFETKSVPNSGALRLSVASQSLRSCFLLFRPYTTPSERWDPYWINRTPSRNKCKEEQKDRIKLIAYRVTVNRLSSYTFTMLRFSPQAKVIIHAPYKPRLLCLEHKGLLKPNRNMLPD